MMLTHFVEARHLAVVGITILAAACTATPTSEPPAPRIVLIQSGQSASVTAKAPQVKKGWHSGGFRRENDQTWDWTAYAGLIIDIELKGNAPIDITATLSTPPPDARQDFIKEASATIRVSGAGHHRLSLPWSAFDYRQAQPAFLKFIQELRVRASSKQAKIASVQVVRGFPIHLSAAVQGKPCRPGSSVEYQAQVTNCSDRPQAISLNFQKHGWEAADPTVEPKALLLLPGATKQVQVKVRLSPRIPSGGRELQVLRAVANGDAASATSLTFATSAEVPHPYVLHTPARWQEVRDKVARYAWAKESANAYIQQANHFVVPEVAPTSKNLTGLDNFGPYLFNTSVANDILATAIAYQLTGQRQYAAKVRTFMLRLSDPTTGYPTTLRGCDQSLVQEGHFFQHIAMAYDAALDSGLFTEQDKAQIDHTLRLYIQTIAFESDMGAINNWNLSEVCGALYCSLVLQDWSLAERFYSGPTGLLDQLGKGVLDDGWWYECATSYNVWCASEFSQAALALEPWGINLRDLRVPTTYQPQYSLIPWAMQPGLYGMSFDKWGPITKPMVSIKEMWDALPRFSDYRGIMFAVNDASENRLAATRGEVGAQPFELAYYLYRDPAYATLIKQSVCSRDLLYGVPELPETTPEQFRNSAYADNVGVALLRSQTPDRPMRDQIQAVLHYGTHGGFHGHYDRTELLHLSRYGRSFYNPEMVWFGYASFMYKFYVQNSTTKNMVVVDRKMQEPTESERLLWHTGKLFQATVVQTKARWSTPPYGGMLYPEQGYKNLQEKAFAEGRFLPKPTPEPRYGSLNDFTEPILQRRLMVVTDDYVLLADLMKGEREHTFENLLQMKGFLSLEATNKRLQQHTPQWDPNPVLDAQFVTDCDWYEAAAPAKARFEMRFGPGADNEGTIAPNSESGILKLDVHNLWPAKQELMVGAVAENHSVDKQLFWNVKGDDKSLGEGQFGAWILGQANVDVPLAGVKELTLRTRVVNSHKPSVFWGNARVVTADGVEIPLSKLPIRYENVLQPTTPGKDYFGGPIKIVGMPFGVATPGQPKQETQPAVIRIDLSGIKAVRFKATLGSDYPLGDETQRRKTYASRAVGSSARFLTIIEPHERESVIKSARALDENHIRVELTDGRVQTIELREFDGDGKSIVVSLTEIKGAESARTETTAP